MIRIGIIGARGFAGGELLRLGLQHPGFQITYVTSESQAGQPVAEGFPGLLGATDLRFSAFNEAEALAAADAFFFALPDGEAMKRAGALLDAGKKVVDLSGDFRVSDLATYQRWYGREHASPGLLARAVYGLPELRPDVKEARLVANPGCYPTAILLALAPLFAARLADPDTLVVDAKSGLSGAGGRAALDPAFSFAAIADNFRAYSVTGHRHIAEMEQELGRVGGAPIAMSFTPHLLPLMRGILATCYVRLREQRSTAELTAAYREFYQAAPFVHVLDQSLPELRYVSGSNACHLAVRYDEHTGRAVCLSAIDNLVKGAAGSAIQNMNLICGL
ncbi:MAG TPA: N-acetyl-gamma-glutamyl-phosphate reductase, partial [Armatimonadota bacterium]|nr:N-acetyl-gamma-glutamyl-phosphate reductase [Armatimonadota bacterium]